MMVFGHSGTGGGFLPAKLQVYPVDYEADVSQRLLEASSCSDLKSAFDCIDDPYLDVNFVGAVYLKVRTAEVHCRDESENVVRFEYQDVKTDATALFVAVHSGNVTLVRKLLGRGADVNQKLFRGYSMTAAVREGHGEIFEILLKAGASQPSCEEALLDASCHGRGGEFIELLMASDFIRPHIAVHALVTACCRGFVHVVDALLKCGVDVNASARVLLCSSKPSLHTNINCTPLVAAVVSRQVAVVRLLLQAGANTNTMVQLGAWSWDTASGDEFKVGAGLAEPYGIAWCAVEYFESSGTILQMLLQHISLHTCHNSRTLLHHAILCGNTRAVETLIKFGSDVESPIKTTAKLIQTRPIHMAARLGFPSILLELITSGCDINSKTKNDNETAQMISVKFQQEECLRVLIMSGADLGLVNSAGQSAELIAESTHWSLTFQKTVLDVIISGTIPTSSNPTVFSPLMFVANSGDIKALKTLLARQETNLDEQDKDGFSAVMVTANRGHLEAFRILVYAGCDVKLMNKFGDTAISLSKNHENYYMFEKVMIEFTLEKGNENARGFYPLHYAARHGDVHAVKMLINRGYDVNIPDGDGYTPLMLSAREGNIQMCQFLIECGSVCGFKNSVGETALSLARKNKNEAEGVILDELARVLVVNGGEVLKYTKGGRGVVHRKSLRMVVGEGVLRWGSSKCRNVICREVEVGPSQEFEKRRKKKGDADMAGVFRVVTVKGKEVHFVCENGGVETAELWVRGIRIVRGRI